MQLDDLAAQIVPLPQAPLLERYLFESPLVPVAVLVIGAVVFFVILNARARLRPAALAGGGLLALAAGVWVLASLVVTPRERLIERAGEVIDATASADTAALGPMLAERAEVRVGDRARYTGRAAILAGVEDYLGGGILESHRIADAQAVIDTPLTARAQLRVRHTGSGVPTASWWLIQWRRASPGSPWIVESIEPLWLAGIGNL